MLTILQHHNVKMEMCKMACKLLLCSCSISQQQQQKSLLVQCLSPKCVHYVHCQPWCTPRDDDATDKWQQHWRRDPAWLIPCL